MNAARTLARMKTEPPRLYRLVGWARPARYSRTPRPCASRTAEDFELQGCNAWSYGSLVLSTHPRSAPGQGALRKAAHVQFPRRTEQAVRRKAQKGRTETSAPGEQQRPCWLVGPAWKQGAAHGPGASPTGIRATTLPRLSSAASEHSSATRTKTVSALQNGLP
jgi:hypothetical protein